jgi:hypothetical protein
MRIYAVQGQLLLLLALSSPALARAQFQQPTSEELAMTADPKAPGASAVYLNVSQVANRFLNFESYYARIKVLTEKGKELATVELPYQKHMYEVADIRGRTIQPDGTIVPLNGKPADLLKTKTKGFQSGRKVFTLPEVQVGSIIEYYFQIRYDEGFIANPYWELQYTYLIHKSHYQCIGCLGLSYSSKLPPGVSLAQDKAGNQTLDLVDVPPAPDEEWMPPRGGMLYMMVFYRSYAQTVDEFWQDVGDSWSTGVNEYTKPSVRFQGEITKLVPPGDPPLEKAKKLYKAVQALDNTDFSREAGKSERKQLKIKDIKHAEDVWTEKSGTRTQIALLYLSMLRAVDLTAYAMRVVDRNLGVFMPGLLDYDQLDDTIIVLSIDGKEIVLDPGEKMCPFQTVRWTHSKATGIRQNAKGSVIGTSPGQSYGANTIQRVANLKLDSHGEIEGDLRFIMAGQEALYWRQKALQNDESEVKKQFDEWIEKMVPDGVTVHIDHFLSLDDPDTNLVAVVNVHGTAGTATSKRLLVPGLFFQTRSSHPFVDSDKRLTPVDMQYGDQITDEVTYTLPAGLEVESAPQTSKIPWEGHSVLIIKTQAAPGQVTITRTLARSFTLASTSEYQDLRAFYQKVAAADQQQLVLTAASSAAKGN